MNKILVVGSLVEDLISIGRTLPKSGESVQADSFSKAAGGKGANQAAAASLIGADVSFFGKTGDDVFAHELISKLRSCGVDTTNIKRADNCSSGVSAISIEKNEKGNENRIFMYPGANYKLTLDDVKFLEDVIPNYSALILQFEIPMEVNEYLIKLAHDKGVFVVVNPAPVNQIREEIFQYIDLLIPNEHEASLLSGCPIDIDADGKANLSQVKTCAKVLLSKGVKNVIITLGVNGSCFYNGKDEILIDAIKGIKSIDPTAAGDSYLGSLVASLMAEFSYPESMKIAAYTSGIVVSKLGAIPSLPNSREVYSLMKERDDTILAESFKDKFGLSITLKDRLDFYKKTVIEEVNSSLNQNSLDDLTKAMNLIIHSEDNGGRIHITGIGKPSHVAEYIASLISSTGTPTYYLHGTEAVHGSCGQLIPGDVVIAISNSGDTLELINTLKAVKKNGCLVIGVSGNKESWLAKNSDAFLLAHVDEEGGPLNKAPRASILSEIIVLQMLSVLLQSVKNIKKDQYTMWHPGGKLGGTY